MAYNYVSYATGLPMSSQTSPQLGRYMTLTNASEKTIELSDVKTHLKINSSITSEDGYLTNLINVATEMVQNYTSLILMQQTIELHLPYFMNKIDINRSPVDTITHVKYYDSANTLQTISSSNYIANFGTNDSLNQSPIITSILPKDNFTYPQTYPRMDAVQIKFVAGIDSNADVPQTIKQAILIIIGSLYLNRTDMVYKMPTLSEYLLNPYRLNVL